MKPNTHALPLFIFLSTLSLPALARFEWVVIERGTFGGYGFAKDRWTAIDRCAIDVESKFIQLAQRCCESTETDTTARFGNRCAGGYSGPRNNRSFSGGVAAYFCWPGNTEQQMASGFWLVQSHPRQYECKELIDVINPIPRIKFRTYGPGKPVPSIRKTQNLIPN